MRLQERYQKQAIPQMMQKFSLKTPMAVPRIEKVALNTGFGGQVALKTADEQKKIAESFLADLAQIAGQKPILTRAKKSIATFKTRKGMPVGAKVTLRGRKMHGFLEKLINVALPRSRDFRGIELSCVDQRGNLTIAIKEHITFPEISPEKVRSIFGFEITCVTSAKNKEEGLELFRLMGFPMKKE